MKIIFSLALLFMTVCINAQENTQTNWFNQETSQEQQEVQGGPGGPGDPVSIDQNILSLFLVAFGTIVYAQRKKKTVTFIKN